MPHWLWQFRPANVDCRVIGIHPTPPAKLSVAPVRARTALRMTNYDQLVKSIVTVSAMINTVPAQAMML